MGLDFLAGPPRHSHRLLSFPLGLMDLFLRADRVFQAHLGLLANLAGPSDQVHQTDRRSTSRRRLEGLAVQEILLHQEVPDLLLAQVPP